MDCVLHNLSPLPTCAIHAHTACPMPAEPSSSQAASIMQQKEPQPPFRPRLRALSEVLEGMPSLDAAPQPESGPDPLQDATAFALQPEPIASTSQAAKALTPGDRLFSQQHGYAALGAGGPMQASAAGRVNPRHIFLPGQAYDPKVSCSCIMLWKGIIDHNPDHLPKSRAWQALCLTR